MPGEPELVPEPAASASEPDREAIPKAFAEPGEEEMTEGLEIFSRDNVETICLVSKFFKGDYEKVKTWLHTPNPMLGYVAPVSMMLTGRSKKLLKFVLACKEENCWGKEDEKNKGS